MDKENSLNLLKDFFYEKLSLEIFDRSVNPHLTGAYYYLSNHRAITLSAPYDYKIRFRFIDSAPSSINFIETEKGMQPVCANFFPAIVLPITNIWGALTGAQLTFLDPLTFNKETENLYYPRKTIGRVIGSAGEVYLGGGDKIILAEGLETAASLIEANHKSDIYCVCGNMRHIGKLDWLAKQTGKKEIYIAADNDLGNPQTQKSLKIGCEDLKNNGINPIVIMPDPINGNKTDFNDIIKNFGVDGVRQYFN